DRIGLAAAWPARGLADQPVVEQARELRVDLAVLRRPDVAQLAVEELCELVAAERSRREQAEQGVPESHRRRLSPPRRLRQGGGEAAQEIGRASCRERREKAWEAERWTD